MRAAAADMINAFKLPTLFNLLSQLQSDENFEVRRSAELALVYLQRKGLLQP